MAVNEIKGRINVANKIVGKIGNSGGGDHFIKKYTIPYAATLSQTYAITQIDGCKIQNALSFDGTKYIDTGYKPTDNTLIDVGFCCNELDGFVYGACSGSAVPTLANYTAITQTTITFGDTIILQAYVSGGIPPYQYTFLCMHSTETKWTTLTSYGTTSKRVWQPKKSGTYTVRSKIKDATGEEAIKDFTLTVNEEGETLSDVEVVSATAESTDAHALYIMSDYSYYRFGTSDVSDISHTVGENYSVQISQSGAFDNGETVRSYDTMSFTGDYSLFIGACNEAGSAGNHKLSGKVYYFKIYESDVLKMNLVPCTRTDDNVSGMYDFVNYRFYPLISEEENI